MNFLQKAGLLLCFQLVTLSSFSQNVTYGYDPSGNRTERGVVVLRAPQAPSAAEENTINEENNPILYRELKVYPNPTQGQVRVELPVAADEAPFTYAVYTPAGSVILTGASFEGAVNLDFSGQPTGIYFVSLSNATASYSLQIVKQ